MARRQRSPYTDALKMTERFPSPEFGTLRLDVTIDDPRPTPSHYTVRVNHRSWWIPRCSSLICNEKSDPRITSSPRPDEEARRASQIG